MAYFVIIHTKHGHFGIVELDQIKIPVDIDFEPIDRVNPDIEYGQRFAHGIAEMAVFPIIKTNRQSAIFGTNS